MVGPWSPPQCKYSIPHDPPSRKRSLEGCIRTATGVLKRADWWHSMSLSELTAPFLNGAQRSVNRKVQGSNPCPGAKYKIPILASCQLFVDGRAAVVQQPHSNLVPTEVRHVSGVRPPRRDRATGSVGRGRTRPQTGGLLAAGKGP